MQAITYFLGVLFSMSAIAAPVPPHHWNLKEFLRDEIKLAQVEGESANLAIKHFRETSELSCYSAGSFASTVEHLHRLIADHSVDLNASIVKTADHMEPAWLKLAALCGNQSTAMVRGDKAAALALVLDLRRDLVAIERQLK